MTEALDRPATSPQGLAQAWVAAERRGDVATLERVLTDDFVGVGPRGYLLTKEQWLQRLRAGDLTYEALELDDATVRVYGEAAVLIARQAQRASYRGHDSSGRFRTSLVLVRQGEQWRLAGVHLRPAADGGPPSSGR